MKVRGAAQHIYEKYQQLARDAGSGGDRVLQENYLQHAEHYFRVLRAMQPLRPLSEIIGRDNFASGYDIDFEEEPQLQEGGEASQEGESDNGEGRWSRDDRGQGQGERPQGGQYDRPQYDRSQNDRSQNSQNDRSQNDRQQTERPAYDRPRDENRQRDDYRPQNDGRPREDRFRDQPRYNRDDRPQGENRARDDRPQGDNRQRDDRPQDRQQGDRPQGDNRQQAERPRYRDDRPARNDRPERDPLGVVEPQATPLTQAPSAPYEAPEPAHGVLRSEDGGVSHAPAFLQQRAPEARPADADEPVAEAKRPRRRRAPRTFEASEGGPDPVEVDEG